MTERDDSKELRMLAHELQGVLADVTQGKTSFDAVCQRTVERVCGRLLALAASGGEDDEAEPGFDLNTASARDWAAYEYGINSVHEVLAAILNGEDTGLGVCREPWEGLRRRVLALRASTRPAPPLGFEWVLVRDRYAGGST